MSDNSVPQGFPQLSEELLERLQKEGFKFMVADGDSIAYLVADNEEAYRDSMPVTRYFEQHTSFNAELANAGVRLTVLTEDPQRTEGVAAIEDFGFRDE